MALGEGQSCGIRESMNMFTIVFVSAIILTKTLPVLGETRNEESSDGTGNRSILDFSTAAHFKQSEADGLGLAPCRYR